MIGHLLFILLGILALMGGSDVAIGGAARLARRLDVSELVIGLTVVAIGTSLPELGTTVTGALASGGAGAEQAAGLAIGNVVGSNIFVLTALLGMTAAIRAIPIDVGAMKRDGIVLIGFTVALVWGFAGGSLGRIFGALLLVAYIAYLAFLFTEVRGRHVAQPEKLGGKEEGDWVRKVSARIPAPPWIQDALVVLAGLATVVVGATVVVNQGVEVAKLMGIPGALIGILVGAATSLPEVMVSVRAAKRGTMDIAIGNILGSSISNIGLCLGAAALAHPLVVSPLMLRLDYPFLVASTLIALALMWNNRELSRADGGVLLVLFGLYMTLRFTAV